MRKMLKTGKWTGIIFLFVLILACLSGCGKQFYGVDTKSDSEIEEMVVAYILDNYDTAVTVTSHTVTEQEVPTRNGLDGMIYTRLGDCDSHILTVALDGYSDSKITVIYNEAYMARGVRQEGSISENFAEDMASYMMLCKMAEITHMYYPNAVICEDKNEGDYDIFLVSNDFTEFSKVANLLKSYIDSMRDEHYASYSIYVFSSEAELAAADITAYQQSDMLVGGLTYGQDAIAAMFTGRDVVRIYCSGNGVGNDIFELNGNLTGYKDSECSQELDDFEYVIRWYSCEPNENEWDNGEIAGSVQVFGVL